LRTGVSQFSYEERNDKCKDGADWLECCMMVEVDGTSQWSCLWNILWDLSRGQCEEVYCNFRTEFHQNCYITLVIPV